MRHAPALAVFMLMISLLLPCPARAESDSMFMADKADNNASQTLTTLSIVYWDYYGHGPLVVARELGLFQKRGLDVRLQAKDWEQDDSFKRNLEIDGWVEIMHKEQASAPTSGAVAVLALAESQGADILAASVELKTLADLKGRSIGLDTDFYLFFLHTVLESTGLGLEDVTVHSMGQYDDLDPFFNGQWDAVVTYGDYQDAADSDQAERVYTLASTRDFPMTMVEVLVLRNSVLASSPDAAQKLAEAWYEAVDWCKAHPAEARTIMAQAFGYETRYVSRDSLGTRILGREENARIMAADGPLFDLAERINGFLLEQNLVSEPVDIEAFLHTGSALAAAGDVAESGGARTMAPSPTAVFSPRTGTESPDTVARLLLERFGAGHASAADYAARDGRGEIVSEAASMAEQIQEEDPMTWDLTDLKYEVAEQEPTTALVTINGDYVKSRGGESWKRLVSVTARLSVENSMWVVENWDEVLEAVY